MEQVIPAEWRRLNKVHRDALVVLALAGGEATVEGIHDGMGGADTGDAPSVPWVSTNVSELVERGLVEKRVNRDNERERIVSLTDDGRAVLLAGVVKVADEIDTAAVLA